MGSITGQISRLLRQFKGTYVLHNLLNRQKLAHNRHLYARYGLRKSIYSPIGSHDFPEVNPEQLPWLDRPDAAQQLEKHPEYVQFSESIQGELRRFVAEGFMILRGYFSTEVVEQANQQIQQLMAEKRIGFNYLGRKIMQSHRYAPVIEQQFFRQPELLRLLSFIMGEPVVPFQTINFISGSEQRAHSDSIHMTTYPPGYLIACWTALEPVTEANGPVFYYPGSHRLPYLMCPDYPSGNTAWTIGVQSNYRYENALQEQLEQAGWTAKSFTAQPGDLLIWHANLIHGGRPIQQPGTTRRSMVAHYFTDNVICYHEISQRPALLEK